MFSLVLSTPLPRDYSDTRDERACRGTEKLKMGRISLCSLGLFGLALPLEGPGSSPQGTRLENTFGWAIYHLERRPGYRLEPK